MQILIKGVNLLNPAQKLNQIGDLLIEDGIIKKVGNVSVEEAKNAKVYDFSNKYCVPGFFDMHVHLREPGKEDIETVETGCNGAAAGGFTGVACMPNTKPCTDNAAIVGFIRGKAAKHLVDVYPVAAATVGRKGESLSPIGELCEAGAVAFSDDGTVIKNASILRNVLEYCSMYNVTVIEHCEDESLAGGAIHEGFVSTQLGLPSIPSIAEDLIVMRDIMMAEYTNRRIHLTHISTKKAVQLIREAKAKGIKVTADVTPHHFTLTDESLKSYNTNLKMNPPLRTREDVDAIIDGLKDGTIDCIASDHAPHSIEDKEVEFIYAPNGIIGLETQLGLAITELVKKGHLTIEQLVEKFAINPRKILNIEVPEIKEGAKANLTIFDADVHWTVNVKEFQSKAINSPFDKTQLVGKSVAVINKNKIFTNAKFEEI